MCDVFLRCWLHDHPVVDRAHLSGLSTIYAVSKAPNVPMPTLVLLPEEGPALVSMAVLWIVFYIFTDIMYLRVHTPNATNRTEQHKILRLQANFENVRNQ